MTINLIFLSLFIKVLTRSPTPSTDLVEMYLGHPRNQFLQENTESLIEGSVWGNQARQFQINENSQDSLTEPPKLAGNQQTFAPLHVEEETPIGFQFVEIKEVKTALPIKYRKTLKNLKIGKSSQLCSICIAPFAKDEIIKKLPCGHILHRDCIKPWLKIDSRCPVCRFDMLVHFTNQDKKDLSVQLKEI